MLKRFALTLAIVLMNGSAALAAHLAVTTGNVNLRAGPAVSFLVITVVPAGSRLATYGCTADYSWCDVSFGVSRGWMSARYIQVVYNGVPTVITPVIAPRVGLAVVTFNRLYWDTYYRAYPWYRAWPRYYRAVPPYRVAPPPRLTSYDRSVECVDGTCTATRSATGLYGGSATNTRTCSGGECSATREVAGPQGYSASRTRTCSANDLSCNVTRTGPAGNSATRTLTGPAVDNAVSPRRWRR
ncbi:MAG: SH3 domain-containing protein [Roseibium sp.]|nr:SH3 domain-containing protein [Roseibium sp.]